MPPTTSPNGAGAGVNSAAQDAGVDSISKSVVKQPIGEGFIYGDYILSAATVADEIPAWGTYPAVRDRKLREFWVTEPILASAIYTTIARYVAFGYELDGPDRMVKMGHNMLAGVEFGRGWAALMVPTLIDYFGQDNGAWIEVIRIEDRPNSPCISLKHLDTSRCIRTGRAEEPIIYYDLQGIGHKMKWYQVIELSEFPMPLEITRGLQLCAVSRCLKAAQLIRDMIIYMSEKMGGRFHRSVHIVGGIQMPTIDDAFKQNQMQSDAAGMRRFVQPLILAALDPTKTVSHVQIDMASLPDGFKFDDQMKWYITSLSLALGADYQDFAPLPGGNLGSAQQSETLHLKSRGKGPRLFMTNVEQKLNFGGIFPSSVKFKFGDQDVAEDVQHARLAKMQADTLAVLIKAGVIDGIIGRQILADYGYLNAEYLAKLGDRDLTPDVSETKNPAAAP